MSKNKRVHPMRVEPPPGGDGALRAKWILHADFVAALLRAMRVAPLAITLPRAFAPLQDLRTLNEFLVPVFPAVLHQVIPVCRPFVAWLVGHRVNVAPLARRMPASRPGGPRSSTSFLLGEKP